MDGGESDQRQSVDSDIGPFRLLSVIGQGGMGVVYRAERRGSGEKVALKTVRNATSSSLLALRSEIASLRAIRNPGIVQIIESGVNAGMPWYAMELIEGRTLRDFNRELWGDSRIDVDGNTGSESTSQSPLLPEGSTIGAAVAGGHFRVPPTWGPVSPGPRRAVAGARLPELLAFYRRLCLPVAHIHSRGLTHRDLKPANIFIRTDGDPVLVDFGLVSYARGTIGRESLQANAPGLGTVAYVSPEQILGLFVDARSDLYSIGCMLYESLTGQPPFANRGRETLERHLRERPVPPSELVDGVPADLDALVMSLLTKSPRDRLGYATDIASVLAKLGGVSAPSMEAEYLYRPQLVGRQPILDRLTDCGMRLDRGAGGLLLLGGPSGLGKTFLLAEFARRERQRGRRVIAGECVPVATHASTMTEFTAGPLHPFRKVLRSISDECHRGGRETAERLLGSRAAFLAAYEPELLRFADGSRGGAKPLPALAARARVLESLVESLSAYSLETPLLILLDDLQWADELTLAFIESLQSTLFETRPLLIVGSYRSEEVNPELERLLQRPHVERASLDRLDDGTIEAIVGDMLGMKEPPAQLIAFLAARAEGNPFFIAEYLRLLVSEGMLKRIDGRWRVPREIESGVEFESLQVPRSLEGIVNRRLESISSEARELVRAASVLGREFSVETLAAIQRVDVDCVRVGLRDATNGQVVEEVADDEYRFSHDKLRESAYAANDPATLRELHLRAAVHLETSHVAAQDIAEHYSELARHYKEAGDSSKTIEYLDKAGGAALSKSAHKEAVGFLRDAIRLVEETSGHLDPLRVARWHRQISDGLQGLGQLNESAGHLRQAAALLQKPAPPKGWQLVISLLLNVVRQSFHRFFPRIFLGRRRESQGLAEAARVHDKLLQVLYFSGDPVEMLHACISSLNLAEVAGDSLDLASAYSNAFAVTGIIPVRGLAESYRRRAFEMNEKRPGTVIECYLRMQSGGYSIGVAAWERASSELARGQAVANELGYRRGWEDCGSIDSIGAYIRSGFEESSEKSLAVYQSALRGDAQTQTWGLIQHAYVLLVQDRLEEALTRLRTAEPLIGEDQKARLEYPWFHAVQARARLRRGEFTGALASAKLALGRMLGGPPVYFAWIEALPALMEVYLELREKGVARDDRDGLRSGAGKTLQIMRAQARIFPAALPQTLLWQGRLFKQLGSLRAAEKSWRRATVAARALGMPFEEASAMREVASSSSTSSRDAEPLLARSAEILAAIGATYELRSRPAPSPTCPGSPGITARTP